jgi:hypothetical protein
VMARLPATISTFSASLPAQRKQMRNWSFTRCAQVDVRGTLSPARLG